MLSTKDPNAINVSALKGIGPSLSAKLAALGITSVLDLLFHLPLRYEDRTRVVSIHSARNGQAAVIEGEVISCQLNFGKRRSLLCKIQDDSGAITLRFFYFSAAQKNKLVVGSLIRCYGEVSLGRNGLELIHPEYEFITDGQDLTPPPYLTAIYPSTEGIHQARWRRYIQAAFDSIDPSIVPELLERPLPEQLGTVPTENLYATLKILHYPPPDIDINLLSEGLHPLQRRLAFEELVAQRISHLTLRHLRGETPAVTIAADDDIESRLLNTLDFQLTNAQRRVLKEIKTDIATPEPMLRLLQGDVGSGKTVIAALVALHCIASGRQVALMAPTEILAGQHAETISRWFGQLNINVTLLLSKLSAGEKRHRMQMIASGESQMTIGTHALIQQGVDYDNLGLVIIDEQHRFGVEQRRKLKDKRNDKLAVHQLIMTATPIPRTLAMTFYADLDYSVIDALPPGRTPIKTAAISNDKRNQVIARVENACAEGRQVYWVCTLIEESEALQCQAAESSAKELSLLLPNIKIGLIHGRMSVKEKRHIMNGFKQAEIQLLVATTVIEVGVDVPNASLMVIENPERLGLSQLHQLRGRVGRGNTQSHCVLLYQKPLSINSRQRIDIMRETTDGFVLAEKDLQMRGPGEVLGTRQSGATLFRLADLERDHDLISAVIEVSDHIYKNRPVEAKQLIRRWCPLATNYISV